MVENTPPFTAASTWTHMGPVPDFREEKDSMVRLVKEAAAGKSKNTVPQALVRVRG